MNRKNIIQTVFLSLCFCSMTGQASAQETVEYLKFQANFESYLNKTVKFEAKYGVCWGGKYIALSKSTIKLYIDPRSKALVKRLNSNKDDANQALEKDSSNVEVVVRVVKNTGQFDGPSIQQRPVLAKLVSIEKQLDDIPRFERKLKTVLEGSSDRIRSMKAIASEARLWASRYESNEVRSWARKTYRKALDEMRTDIKLNEVDKWIVLGNEYIALVRDQNTAIRVLGAVFNKLEQKGEGEQARKKIAQFLKSLNASYYRQKWLPEAEFRAAENFVRSPKTNDWIRRETLEFQVVIASDKARKIDFLTELDSVYRKSAESGKILEYMRPFHLSNLRTGKDKVLGLPSTTAHRVVETINGTRKYTQWIMSDSSRFYFANGRLFRWFLADADYLQK